MNSVSRGRAQPAKDPPRAGGGIIVSMRVTVCELNDDRLAFAREWEKLAEIDLQRAESAKRAYPRYVRV